MSRRGGYTSSGSGSGISSFNSFVKSLPSQAECSSTPLEVNENKGSSMTSSNFSSYADNSNKENAGGDFRTAPAATAFATFMASNESGFGSSGKQESSGNTTGSGTALRGGRGGLSSFGNQESSGHTPSFNTSNRGGRGGSSSFGNQEPSGHATGFNTSSRGGRGGLSSFGNQEPSGHATGFNTSSRGGRGGLSSFGNQEPSGHATGFNTSSRGGRGGHGSSHNEESSGQSATFSTSSRGGRGGHGSSHNEESSGHTATSSTSSRGGKGVFGSTYGEGSSGDTTTFNTSSRGGKSGGRGGGFAGATGGDNNCDGGDMEDFLSNMHSVPNKSGPSTHVPIDRSIDVLIEEDMRNNVYYSQVADQDDDIVVEGAEYRVKFDNWAECEFAKPLVENIKLTGYVRPRNIQAFTMPQIMNGYDVKGQAETGSGKTAAFLLPIINSILESPYERKPRSPYAIIVSPTRELALQTHEQARKFSNNTDVRVAKCYGQYKISENLAEIDRGCDILSATPGRLKSFVENGDISLECLKYFVLDEADELFGGSFVETIREILMIGGAPPKEERINMLFSATFPAGVDALASELLREGYVTIVNRCTNGANKKVSHAIVQVDKNDKNITVCNMLLEEKKEAERNNQKLKRTLVFVGRKQQADMLSMFFCERGVNALSLNGDRPQRLREEALNDFRAHKVSVLVTTDVCARGIDIKNLDHVINVDLPKEFVTFIHRVGRTGRLQEGFATSFYDPNSDYGLKENLVDILRLNGKPIPEFLL